MVLSERDKQQLPHVQHAEEIEACSKGFAQKIDTELEEAKQLFAAEVQKLKTEAVAAQSPRKVELETLKPKD